MKIVNHFKKKTTLNLKKNHMGFDWVGNVNLLTNKKKIKYTISYLRFGFFDYRYDSPFLPLSRYLISIKFKKYIYFGINQV